MLVYLVFGFLTLIVFFWLYQTSLIAHNKIKCERPSWCYLFLQSLLSIIVLWYVLFLQIPNEWTLLVGFTIIYIFGLIFTELHNAI